MYFKLKAKVSNLLKLVMIFSNKIHLQYKCFNYFKKLSNFLINQIQKIEKIMIKMIVDIIQVCFIQFMIKMIVDISTDPNKSEIEWSKPELFKKATEKGFFSLKNDNCFSLINKIVTLYCIGEKYFKL